MPSFITVLAQTKNFTVTEICREDVSHYYLQGDDNYLVNDAETILKNSPNLVKETYNDFYMIELIPSMELKGLEDAKRWANDILSSVDDGESITCYVVNYR